MKQLLTFLRVDGHLVRVSVRGEGRPLLLVMGLGGNIEMWGPLERALNARQIQTIAYDAAGTGDSPPRLVPRRMAGLAREAVHLVDELGYGAVDVLGVSLGGAVAQELALRHPSRVRRLVLASTLSGLGGSLPGNPLSIAIMATPLRYYSPTFMRFVANTLYGPSVSTDGDLLSEQVEVRQARPPSLWGYAAQLTATMGWSSVLRLPRLRSPTLVISGEADPIVPPINARILARRIPKAQLELFSGAGHLLLMEQAEACAGVIAKFLDDPVCR